MSIDIRRRRRLTQIHKSHYINITLHISPPVTGVSTFYISTLCKASIKDGLLRSGITDSHKGHITKAAELQVPSFYERDLQKHHVAY